jgi:type I restriction enzyme S subunit
VIAGWKKLRIGDWGEVVGGRQRSPHLTAGTLRPYLRVANVFEDRIDTSDVLTMLFTDAEFSRFKLQSGDILLNEGQSLELVGRSAIYEGSPPDCAFQNTLVRFRAGPECDYRFAQQVFKQLWRTGAFQGIAKRTTSIAHLGVTRFADLKVTVPPPPAQRTIAHQLGLFDSTASTIDRLIIAKRKFKRGLMRQLLTGAKQFPEFIGVARRTLSLRDFLTLRLRPVTKPGQHYRSLGIRSHGRGTFEHGAKDPSTVAMETLYEVRRDDLILNITFGWEGAVAIVNPRDEGALVSHRFPTFTVDTNEASIRYLAHLIRTKWFVHSLGLVSPGGAGRNRVLNKQDFLSISVSLPPVLEQEKVASVLDCCDHEIDLLTALREKIELQKRALLSRLLSGELKVPA